MIYLADCRHFGPFCILPFSRSALSPSHSGPPCRSSPSAPSASGPPNTSHVDGGGTPVGASSSSLGCGHVNATPSHVTAAAAAGNSTNLLAPRPPAAKSGQSPVLERAHLGSGLRKSGRAIAARLSHPLARPDRPGPAQPMAMNGNGR